MFHEEMTGVWEFETIDFIHHEDPAFLAYIEGILVAGIRVIDYDDLSRLDGAVYGFGEMFAPIKEKDDVIETVKEEKRKLELNLADTYSRMQKLMEENERLQLSLIHISEPTRPY